MLAADERITAWAGELKAAGLDGGMDELRARAYLDLLLGKDSRPGQDQPGAPGQPGMVAPAPGGFAGPVKRSITIAGHETSVSLEPIFWEALESAARDRGLPLSALVAQIDHARITAPAPPNVTAPPLSYAAGISTPAFPRSASRPTLRPSSRPAALSDAKWMPP